METVGPGRDVGLGSVVGEGDGVGDGVGDATRVPVSTAVAVGVAAPGDGEGVPVAEQAMVAANRATAAAADTLRIWTGPRFSILLPERRLGHLAPSLEGQPQVLVGQPGGHAATGSALQEP